MALFKRKQTVVIGTRDPKEGWKPNKHAGGANHDESNWLVSYADMMTLLCGFFILLFSMAKLDTPKYEAMKEEMSKQFGGKYEIPPTNELAEFFKTTFADMGVADKTVVKFDPSSVSVSFQSTMFFDTLSAEVKPEGRALLQRIIAGIADKQLQAGKQFKIAIEGHTDSRPVLSGIYPSNWELAGARSAHVSRMFIERGFKPTQLASLSYADTRPEVEPRLPDGTFDESALMRNRRVVIRIMDPKVDAIPFPDATAPRESRAVASAPGAADPQQAAAQPPHPSMTPADMVKAAAALAAPKPEASPAVPAH